MLLCKRDISVVVLILILCGCSESADRKPPETVSEVLNKRVRSAAFQYINLDKAEVHQVRVSQKDIIYSVTGDHSDEEPLLGRLWDYTLVDNRFYAFDASSKAVFRIDLDGSVEGPLTREGRGPGEHSSMGNLSANNKYIYLPDANNARINRYTHEMEPVEPLDQLGMSTNIDLNEDHILTQNWYSSGFSPPHPEQEVLAILAIDDLTDTLATIMPRIIPAGYQPQVYNGPMYSINDKNEIAASYRPLPWIFLYDEEYNHIRTLILEYSEFEKMDIPAMDFFKPKGNKGFGGTMPINQFRLFDYGDLFLTIRRRLIHLSPEDGTYQVKGIYALHIGDKEKAEVVFEVFPSSSGSEIFAANWHHLFRFKPEG